MEVFKEPGINKFNEEMKLTFVTSVTECCKFMCSRSEDEFQNNVSQLIEIGCQLSTCVLSSQDEHFLKVNVTFNFSKFRFTINDYVKFNFDQRLKWILCLMFNFMNISVLSKVFFASDQIRGGTLLQRASQIRMFFRTNDSWNEVKSRCIYSGLQLKSLPLFNNIYFISFQESCSVPRMMFLGCRSTCLWFLLT